MAPLFRGAWLAVCLTACQSTATLPAGAERFDSWDRCQLGATGLPHRTEARCRTLRVPENHGDPGGRTIDLHVAVLPSDAFRPLADPLFFFAGGPGQAASESYVPYEIAFARVNRKRDIVLIDQRGTGRSNRLACIGPTDHWLGGHDDEAEGAAWLRRCLESYDADLTHYTTADAVRDFERVRAALGYQKVNLYGISYGTRVALEIIRHHPDRVRSAILDGVVPGDVAIGIDAAADAQRALTKLLARCESDAVCGERFPRLGERLDHLLEGLEKSPVHVSVRHPRTGAVVGGELNHLTFGGTLRLMTYSSAAVSLLPLWIDEATTSGSLDRFASQAVLAFSEVDEMLARGLNMTVLCSEDVPFWPEGNNPGPTYLGESMVREIRRACAVWPKAEVAAPSPVTSEVPVLLLSGDVDPVTPPKNGERAAHTLPNSRHLVANGLGHGVVTHTCVHRIANAFIEAASVADLDTTCMETIRPEPFFVGRGGPEP